MTPRLLAAYMALPRIIAYQRAVDYFSIAVGNVNIAFLQLDDRRVVSYGRFSAFTLGLLLHIAVEIWAQRHKLRGQSSSSHNLVGMQYVPAVLLSAGKFSN